MHLLFFAVVAFADETVALNALPAPVAATLARQWPTAHAVSAAKDGDELEVLLTDGSRRFEAMIKPDGTWVETEEVVEVSALPPAIVAAGKGQGSITRAEMRTTAAGVTDYELLVHSKGKDIELKLDSAGAIESREDAEEEDEKDEKDEKDEANEHR